MFHTASNITNYEYEIKSSAALHVSLPDCSVRRLQRPLQGLLDVDVKPTSELFDSKLNKIILSG